MRSTAETLAPRSPTRYIPTPPQSSRGREIIDRSTRHRNKHFRFVTFQPKSFLPVRVQLEVSEIPHLRRIAIWQVHNFDMCRELLLVLVTGADCVS